MYIDLQLEEERQEPVKKIMNDENDDKNEDSEDEDKEDSNSKGDDEDDEDEDDADVEKEPQQQPPRKITKNIKGVKKHYYYQTTLKSMEELGEFRYKVIKIFNFLAAK
jgi:hypothetical protein